MSISNDSITVNFDGNSQIPTRKSNQRKQIIKIPQHHAQTITQRNKFKSKYFTTGHGIDNKTARNVLNEPSPYLVDVEEFSHKTTRKTYRTGDLLKRLYVDEPNVANYQTIIDVAPDFYQTTQGRPIREQQNLREYIATIRDVLRTRVVNGYRQDDLLQIEEKLILEQNIIDETRKKFKLYASTFEEFLYNDHLVSMALLKESENEMNLAQTKHDEYRQLSKDYGALRSILYKTEEKWRDTKLYQRFLYLMSPMEWREQHDRDLNVTTDLQLVSKAFGKYRLSSDKTSLEDLLENFVEDIESTTIPELYFTEPQQLVDAFRFIEIQNLNFLLQVEELAEPLENIQNGLNSAEDLFKTEMEALEETLQKISVGIVREEKRAEFLQEVATNLINSQYRDLLVSDEILNLKVLIEDVYEKLIGPSDGDATISRMMEELEMKFYDELLHFDQLPLDLVQRIERKYYRNEMKLMKKAEKAARKLLEFEQLFDKLIKVTLLASSGQKPKRRLVWRSAPVNPPPPKSQPLRPLTDEEINFLDFFTIYPKDNDNLADYGIDLRGPPKNWFNYVSVEEVKPDDDDDDDEDDQDEEVKQIDLS